MVCRLHTRDVLLTKQLENDACARIMTDSQGVLEGDVFTPPVAHSGSEDLVCAIRIHDFDKTIAEAPYDLHSIMLNRAFRLLRKMLNYPTT